MAEGPASDTAAAAGGSFDRRLNSRRGHDYDDDPFANFSYTPPKPSGRLRFYQRRSKYHTMASLNASRERLAGSGSNTSLSSFGSSQNLNLDPAKRFSMQEDAKSRKISAEVMKHRLYESVITSPRRRRMSVRGDYSGPSSGEEMEMQGFAYAARMAQSLPVTPAITPSQSQNVTPAHSPTTNRRFLFGFFSRGTTPDEENKCIQVAKAPEQENWTGLASIFKPQPRCIPVSRASNMDHSGEQDDIENRLYPVPNQRQYFHQREDGMFFQEKSHQRLQSPPQQPCQQHPCPVMENEINAVAPTSF